MQGIRHLCRDQARGQAGAELARARGHAGAELAQARGHGWVTTTLEEGRHVDKGGAAIAAM